jgi:hypothetical protein
MATFRGASAASYLMTRGWIAIEQDPEVYGDPVLKDPNSGVEYAALDALGVQRVRDIDQLTTVISTVQTAHEKYSAALGVWHRIIDPVAEADSTRKLTPDEIVIDDALRAAESTWDTVAGEDVPNLCVLARSILDVVRDQSDQIGDLRKARDTLQAAIAEHHAQKADDRCFLDDDELYAVARLPPVDRTIGNPAAMLENCKRFIAQRCQGGGLWKSYAELEAENKNLLSVLNRVVRNACRPGDDGKYDDLYDDAMKDAHALLKAQT